MNPTPRRRVVIAVLAVVLLAAAALVDHAGRPKPAAAAPPPGAEGPHAPPPSALSASWYCPGGPGGGSTLLTTITVANVGTEARSGTLTFFPAGGKPTSRTLDVPAAASVGVPVSVPGPWVSAVVDMDGGGVIAEQSLEGGGGMDATACSATASQHWYFASGSTAKDATLSLALFNPFPDDATADVDFATSDGWKVPGDFQSIVVGARTTRLVDIGAHVRREDAVSTEVRVRAGRLVAGEQLVRTAPGVAGVSTTVGQPSLGATFYFPDGLVNPGVAERYELFNPGNAEAHVEVALALERDEADPFELVVPAQGRIVLPLNGQPRVPNGVAHAAVVNSTNGVPVAVARVFEATGARSGRTDTIGAVAPARRWALAVGAVNAIRDEWVVVQNDNARPASVSVTALEKGQRVAVEGLQGIVVPAGRRLALRLSDHIKRDALPLVISANQPVVVERSYYVVGGIGLSASVGIPLD